MAEQDVSVPVPDHKQSMKPSTHFKDIARFEQLKIDTISAIRESHTVTERSDHDSDSDDGFKVQKTKIDPVHDEIESMEAILQQILSINQCDESFLIQLEYHSKLLIDLLRTHFSSTTNPHLLSLLLIAVDLLMTNKSEIGLLCFNRVSFLCLLGSCDPSTPSAISPSNGVHSYSLSKKSLRILNTMTIRGPHLLPLIYEPFTQHLALCTSESADHDKHSVDDSRLWVRSAAVLQIAKLFVSAGHDHRKIMEDEWKWKETLYDILFDREEDQNMDAVLIQNVLHAYVHHVGLYQKCSNS